MPPPRLLLLTAIAPGRVNIGRTYVRDLCLLYPRDRICCVHLHPLPDHVKSPELDWLPMAFVPGPPEFGYRKLGEIVARLTRPVIEALIDVVVSPRLVRRIARYGEEQQAELVCAILHGPTSIRVAKAVAASLRVPLVTLVWDSPAQKLAEHFMHGATRSRLLARFGSAIRAAVRCGVMSEGMKQRYQRDYGTPCTVIRYGHRRAHEIGEPQRQSPDRPIIIGFAGAMYTPVEWETLIGALSGRDWRLAGRDVVIRVFGSLIHQRASGPVRIEYLGWRKTDDMLRQLSQMDVAYLPYRFDEAYREQTQLAFPSKLSTYVTARIPVFYHGPRGSSAALFLDKYPVGVACHSLDPDAIIQSLERLVSDPVLRERAIRTCDDAFDQELSGAVFRRRFAELIGIPEDDLLPATSLNA
jgi:hypothetical protein